MNWLIQLIPIVSQIIFKIIDAARQHHAGEYDQHEPVAPPSDVVYISEEQLRALREAGKHG